MANMFPVSPRDGGACPVRARARCVRVPGACACRHMLKPKAVTLQSAWGPRGHEIATSWSSYNSNFTMVYSTYNCSY